MLLVLLLCSAVCSALTEEMMLNLVRSYEKSQNTRDAELLMKIVSPNITVWLPSGEGQPVVGQAAVKDFFVAFFGNFATFMENVSEVARTSKTHLFLVAVVVVVLFCFVLFCFVLFFVFFFFFFVYSILGVV